MSDDPVFLSDKFLNWPCGNDSASGLDPDYLFRAHEIWRHAKHCVADQPTEFDRVDCVSSLRRAINHRLKSISKAYQFQLLPSLRAKRQTLEIFQDYGLVRPSLIKDLLEVRNLIEHQDKKPPSTKKCRYYVDVVWYFLKSTDALISMRTDEIKYAHVKNGSEIVLRILPQQAWKIAVVGNVQENMLFDQPKASSIKLSGFRAIKGRHPGFVSFSGDITADDGLLTRIARDYFGAAGYWYDDHI